MTTYAIIVAGGQGTRMGTAMPKQFLDVGSKPVLYHTIKAFAEAVPGIHIILVLPPQQISYLQMVLAHFPERIDLTVVSGGETRFQSVVNGTNGIPDDAIIMVHDGVRPLVSKALIQRCLEEAKTHGSAIPSIKATDSMRVTDGTNSIPLNRENIRIIQTPQTFKASILLPALLQPFDASFTDEATVAEAFGASIHLVEGEKTNIKITTPEDLLIAEALLKLQQ